MVLPAGEGLFHLHQTSFAGDSFNPNTHSLPSDYKTGARFSPFDSGGGLRIATWYGADDFASACYESIFHEVVPGPTASYPRSQLIKWCVSRIVLNQDLSFVPLTPPDLSNVVVPGRTAPPLSEAELIQSLRPSYPDTRNWGRWFHHCFPAAAGLLWRPRLGPSGYAYVLFKDRVPSGGLPLTIDSEPVTQPPWLAEVEDCAKRAGIVLT